jgi:L-gulonate 3-dehydrogenase
VEDGCISVEDLDITVKDGLGLRWSFMGPFETIDLNAPGGLRDYCQRYGGLYQSISTQQASTEPWTAALVEKIETQRRSLLPQSKLLERRQWRDDRLMELIVHKREDQSAGKN